MQEWIYPQLDDPRKDWGKGEEDAYMAARRKYISDRADWYLENAKATEMDVWLYEADDQPLLSYIADCQKDPIEGALRLTNAIYRIALKRAAEDADEMGVTELMGRV